MKCKKYGCVYKGNATKYEEHYEVCPKCGEVQLKDEYKLILELSPKQAYVIQKALDNYSRGLMGQLEYSMDDIRWQNETLSKKGIAPVVDWHNDIVPDLNELKRKLFGFQSNEFYGIFNIHLDPDARISWDIHQVIRNKISWTEHPKGGMTVNYDRPLKSSSEDLPNAEIRFQ